MAVSFAETRSQPSWETVARLVKVPSVFAWATIVKDVSVCGVRSPSRQLTWSPAFVHVPPRVGVEAVRKLKPGGNVSTSIRLVAVANPWFTADAEKVTRSPQ